MIHLRHPVCLALDNADKTTIYNLVKDAVSKYQRDISLIGCILHESHDWKEAEDRQITHFKKACDHFRVAENAIIVNDTYKQSRHKISLMPIYSINFFAVDCYYRTHYCDQNINSSWNWNSSNPLFLTGKAEKINRIGLLALLRNQGILEQTTYSFFPCRSRIKETKKIYKKFTDYPFDKFCKNYTTSPDNILVTDNENGSHYSGYPFCSSLYKNSLFSIISESNFDGFPIWLTEKTYKTIVNRHPFIMAGQPGTLKYLKELGFYTFEEYCKIKNYNEISDTKKRLSAIVENIKHVKSTLIENRKKVNFEVNENYTNLRRIFKKELESIEFFQDEYFFHNFFRRNMILN